MKTALSGLLLFLLLLLLLLAVPQAPVTADEAERTRLNYLSPVFKIDESEHRKLIEEAGQVRLMGYAVRLLYVP